MVGQREGEAGGTVMREVQCDFMRHNRPYTQRTCVLEKFMKTRCLYNNIIHFSLTKINIKRLSYAHKLIYRVYHHLLARQK